MNVGVTVYSFLPCPCLLLPYLKFTKPLWSSGWDGLYWLTAAVRLSGGKEAVAKATWRRERTKKGISFPLNTMNP